MTELTSSQRNFLECAEIYERCAKYLVSQIYETMSNLEKKCLQGEAEIMLAKAKHYRQLAE